MDIISNQDAPTTAPTIQGTTIAAVVSAYADSIDTAQQVRPWAPFVRSSGYFRMLVVDAPTVGAEAYCWVCGRAFAVGRRQVDLICTLDEDRDTRLEEVCLRCACSDIEAMRGRLTVRIDQELTHCAEAIAKLTATDSGSAAESIGIAGCELQWLGYLRGYGYSLTLADAREIHRMATVRDLDEEDAIEEAKEKRRAHIFGMVGEMMSEVADEVGELTARLEAKIARQEAKA